MKSSHLQTFLPTRLAWLWAVMILGIFLFAFCWYVSHQIYLAFQPIGHQLILDLETNSTVSDSVESFFSYTDSYLLVIALLGLMFFVFVYAMKKGRVVEV